MSPGDWPDGLEGKVLTAGALSAGDTIYQVMVDSLNKSQIQTKRNVSCFRDTNCLTPRTEGHWQGGTIDDLVDLMNRGYVNSDAIYLNPVWVTDDRNDAYHGYWIKDHCNVDSRLGGNEAFGRLVDACNEKDIKLIIDVVLNHASLENPLLKHAIMYGPLRNAPKEYDPNNAEHCMKYGSKFFDWFEFVKEGNYHRIETLRHNWQSFQNGNLVSDEQLPQEFYNFYMQNLRDCLDHRPARRRLDVERFMGTWWNHKDLPKWNINNPAVVKYLVDCIKPWVRMGVNMRFDVPLDLGWDFWKYAMSEWKKVSPHGDKLFTIAEIWKEQEYAWLYNFTSIMGYAHHGRLNLGLSSRFRNNPQVLEQYRQSPETVPGADGTGYEEIWKIGPRRLAIEMKKWQKRQGDSLHTLISTTTSHDTWRRRSMLENDFDSFMLSMMFEYTFPGIPHIFAGDELFMPGKKDPDSRRRMPENLEAMLDPNLKHMYFRQEQVLAFDKIKELEAMHIDPGSVRAVNTIPGIYECLATGIWECVQSSGLDPSQIELEHAGDLAYIRAPGSKSKNGEHTMLVVANLSDKGKPIKIKLFDRKSYGIYQSVPNVTKDTEFDLVWSWKDAPGTIKMQPGQKYKNLTYDLEVTLPPRSGAIYITR